MTFATRPLGFDPPAPVKRAGLSRAQCAALVTIFFAGEMNRSRKFYIAEGGPSILGTTVDVLHAKSMVSLSVEKRPRPNFGKIIEYRYFVKLTPRGEWYAATLIHEREQIVSALSPAIAADDFEDSSNVYPEEQEVEGVE
jgi:hypothetical protein